MDIYISIFLFGVFINTAVYVIFLHRRVATIERDLAETRERFNNHTHDGINIGITSVASAISIKPKVEALKQPRNKLTRGDAEAIRNLYAKGMTQAGIAKIYGCGYANISAICNNKTWKK